MPDAPPCRGFPVSEFEHRLARAHALMAARGLDGILLMSEPELRYFTGFHTLFWLSPTRPWFAFVPASGKPAAIIPDIGAPLMRRGWLDDIRTWSAPSPEDDGISLLTDLLAPHAREGRAIGVMKGHESSLRMPLGDYERLIAGLPGLRIIDATPVIRALRMIKSPAEIAKIARICTIASRSFARVPELLSAGQPLAEAFRAFRIELLRQGADDVPYLVGGAGEGGYDDIISPPSERALSAGDVVMLDTGAVRDGYFCDFDRNFAISRAGDAAQRAYRTLHLATDAGLAAARPGATAAEVFRAMQSVIEAHGYAGGDVGRLGHGLGMQLTEWPSVAPWDATVLREDMTITLEPSLGYGDGRVMVHEENIVIQQGPPRLLSDRAAPELPIIG